MTISIIGAGAFGTSLAIALSANGPVTLWSRDASAAAEMQRSRTNAKRLPGIPFPKNMVVTSDLSIAFAAQTILLALPAQSLLGFLRENGSNLGQKSVVACCKGIDLSTGQGPTRVITDFAPDAIPAILTGPSFATDIAKGLPTALTLACADSTASEAVQIALSTPVLRLYRTTDTVGAELGGALKNVMAIACGTCIGAGLGDSARAALMTRGFAEMQRLANDMGARPETLAGLSGLGDLALTCTSDMSRNFRFGIALGQGGSFDQNTTVEGVTTAKAVSNLAQKRNLDLPICEMVYALTDGKITPKDAMARLLSRPLKEE